MIRVLAIVLGGLLVVACADEQSVGFAYDSKPIPAPPAQGLVDLTIAEGACVALTIQDYIRSPGWDVSTTIESTITSVQVDDPSIAVFVASTRQWQAGDDSDPSPRTLGADSLSPNDGEPIGGDESLAPIFVVCGVHLGTTTIHAFKDSEELPYGRTVAVVAQPQ